MPSIRAHLVKLDIGSGNVQMDGWTTVDLYNDLAEYHVPMWDLPFGEASVSEINCTHALEHVTSHQVIDTLAEFRRVLVPMGTARIEVPDLDWCCERWLHGNGVDRTNAYAGLYGEGEKQGRGHMGGFDQIRLREFLVMTGFEEPLITHDFGYGMGVLVAYCVSP